MKSIIPDSQERSNILLLGHLEQRPVLPIKTLVPLPCRKVHQVRSMPHPEPFIIAPDLLYQYQHLRKTLPELHEVVKGNLQQRTVLDQSHIGNRRFLRKEPRIGEQEIPHKPEPAHMFLPILLGTAHLLGMAPAQKPDLRLPMATGYHQCAPFQFHQRQHRSQLRPETQRKRMERGKPPTEHLKSSIVKHNNQTHPAQTSKT